MAEAGSDTLVVIEVEAGSKARTNYRLTCSCQGLGCKSALLWLHILCLCVHNAVETGDNAVETGDRDQGGGHAGTHVEGIVTSWNSGVSCDRRLGLQAIVWPLGSVQSHVAPQSPPEPLHCT